MQEFTLLTNQLLQILALPLFISESTDSPSTSPTSYGFLVSQKVEVLVKEEHQHHSRQSRT